MTMLGFEESFLIRLQMKKHMFPFDKFTFRTTLICLFFDVIMSHDQIFFERTENGHADFKS